MYSTIEKSLNSSISKIFSLKPQLKFFVLSSIGIFMLLFPISTDTGITIPVAILSKNLAAILSPWIDIIFLTLFSSSSILSICISLWSLRNKNKSLYPLFALFNPSPSWLIIRCLGTLLLWAFYFYSGPHWLLDNRTGGLIVNQILPSLFSIFIFASLFLPLISNFGLMEFIGTLTSSIMKPLFKLPGRASVNCITSWFGDGTVGVLLTSKQYELGYYTQKEAAIIATNFSAVSITFCLFISSLSRMESYFPLIYFTATLCGLLCAIILPRIPPLKNKRNSYHINSHKNLSTTNSKNILLRSYNNGLKKAQSASITDALLKQSLFSICEMLFCVLPIVMLFGTISLAISYYTPILDLIGLPFQPLLKALSIPDVELASKTVFVGFAEVFIPALIIQDSAHELTRFVITALSISQILFIAETGAVILASKIPLNFIELVIIFVMRTLISLPVIALIGHLFF